MCIVGHFSRSCTKPKAAEDEPEEVVYGGGATISYDDKITSFESNSEPTWGAGTEEILNSVVLKLIVLQIRLLLRSALDGK
jgi:hypothetical protein